MFSVHLSFKEVVFMSKLIVSGRVFLESSRFSMDISPVHVFSWPPTSPELPCKKWVAMGSNIAGVNWHLGTDHNPKIDKLDTWKYGINLI